MLDYRYNVSFYRSCKKLSLVLLQITTYIYGPWKMFKKKKEGDMA